MSFGRSPRASTLASSAVAAGLLLSGCVGGPGPEPLAERGLGLQPDRRLTQAELAARPEPRSAAEVAAIEAELEAIARQRAGSASPQEIAALAARARELQRLVAAEQAAPPRR